MFRQVGIGAAAVLAVGMLAVGCSEDGDTIVQGGSGGSDLLNGDQLNASSVTSNNLAPDGGGLSPDSHNATLGQVRIVFACDASASDGTFAGDNSAILLFRTQDADVVRVHASHYQSGAFTPPVELKAADRDERIAAVGSTNIQAAVAMFAGTAQYGGTSTNSTVANDVRSNAGNWYIAWPGRTFFQDPRLTQSHAPPAGTRGPHDTVYFTVFVKSLRDQAATTSTKVGGVTRDFQYGFQVEALEVPTAVGGAVATTAVPAGIAAVQRAGGTPASNVTSFGMVSDGFAGQTHFGGTALPASDTAGSNVTTNTATRFARAIPNTTGAALQTASYQVGEAVNFLGIVYTQIVNSFSGGGTFSAGNNAAGTRFEGGEDLKMFFSSINLATNTFETPTEVPMPNARNTGALTAGTAFYPQFSTYNQFVFTKYMDASLNVEVAGNNDSEDLLGLINSGSIAGAQLGAGSAQDWDQAETGGHDGGSIRAASTNQGFWEDITARFRVVDDGDGTSSISGTLEDNNFFGATGDHDITNPTINNTGRDTYPNNREMQNYNTDGTQFVFGADEGLVDTVAFYVTAANSGTGGSTTVGQNIDRALAAIGLNADNTLITGTNPVLLSTHEVDFQNPAYGGSGGGNGNQLNSAGNGAVDGRPAGAASGQILRDPLLVPGQANGTSANAVENGVSPTFTNRQTTFFKTAMNRTGEYVAVAYLQNRGTSLAFRQALMTVVYQTFRTQTGTTGGTVTAPNFNVRFSTATEVSNQNATDTAIRPRQTFGNEPDGDATVDAPVAGGNTNVRWNQLPVNDFMFQGDLGYRCGLQGNKNIVNLLWEQSDSTEDRAFVRQVSVTPQTAGTPTVTLGAVTGEIDGGTIAQNVSGAENFNQSIFNDTPARTTFRFIDRDLIPLSDSMAACDLGADSDAQNVSAADGGLLIVYRKITDNTTSDNDIGDAAVVALEWVGAAFTTANRVVIDRNINENAPAQVLTAGAPTFGHDGDTVGGNSGAFGTSTNSGTAGTAAFGTAGYDAGVFNLVCIGDSADITANSGNNPATAHYILFSDSRSDNFTSATSLYTRKYVASIRANATEAAAKPNVGDRLDPPAGTGPGSTTYKDPIRLDHLQGSNVANVQVVESGTSVLVFFTQDNHVWAQQSSDGVTWLTSGGAPNPALVDNDTTADVIGPNFTVQTCDNGTCGVGDGIIGFVKDDVDGDDRFRVRTQVRP